MAGTVNISRSIWKDTAFKSQPFTEREAFMWMIMEASYKPREKRAGNIMVKLDRGQLLCAVRFMAEAWGWSKSTVDRFLKRLENRDMIHIESGTGINVVTICKYNDYQNKPSERGTEDFEKRDSSGTAAGQQRDKPNKGLIPDAIQQQLPPREGGNSEPDPTARERLLAAMGADPRSGMIGPNGKILGTTLDTAEAGKWAGMGILLDAQCAVIAERCAAMRRTNANWVPSRFSYFTGAMADLAAARDRPLPQAGGQSDMDEKRARWKRLAGEKSA